MVSLKENLLFNFGDLNSHSKNIKVMTQCNPEQSAYRGEYIGYMGRQGDLSELKSLHNNTLKVAQCLPPLCTPATPCCRDS